MACKAAKLQDEYRYLILRQFPNSLFDAKGFPTREASSTSAKLTHRDFEGFMGVVEYHAGGQIKLPSKTYSRGYWQEKAADPLQRVRHYAGRLVRALEAAGLLEANGAGVAGWIARCVRKGVPAKVEDLDSRELHSLINGLRSYAQQHGITCETGESCGIQNAPTISGVSA